MSLNLRKTSALLGFAIAMLLGISQNVSRADYVVYTNRTAFETALGTPITIEDFSDTTLVPGLSYTSTTGSASISSGRFNDRLTSSTSTTFSFVPNITGFGGNFDLSPGGEGLGIQLTTILPGGGTELITTQIPNTFTGQFFGFITTNQLVSVRLTAGTQGGIAETYNLDNLTFGGSVVPEPSTILSAFLVMIAGGVVQMRRRQLAA